MNDDDQSKTHVQVDERGVAVTSWMVDPKGEHCCLMLRPKNGDEDLMIQLTTASELGVWTTRFRRALIGVGTGLFLLGLLIATCLLVIQPWSLG